MTLSWLIKIRILAVLTLGATLIGFLTWPIANPADPYGAVLFGKIGVFQSLALLVLAFATGAVGSLIARPYGEKIGILAVPAGLAIWAVRSGDMATEILKHNSEEQRKQLYAAMSFEVFFWLIIIAAGFAGALLAKKFILPAKTTPPEKPAAKPKLHFYLNAAAAVALSGVIAQFLIGVLARDVSIIDQRANLVLTGQPASPQIIFALLVSFAAAGFVIKKFLNSCYIWTIISAGLISFISFFTYVRSDILPYAAQNWPFVFFSNPVLSVLPLQMAAFSCLGAVWGYWLAVRYDYWRKHELG